MKKIYYSLLLTAMLSVSAWGQQAPLNRWHFEVEPLQFVNRGWSVVAHYTISTRFQIGTNAFSQVLSPGLTNFAFPGSGGRSIQATQDFGMNLSIRYFLQERDLQSGWVTSLPLGWETWTIRDPETEGEASYAFWYLSPRIGYLWFPLKNKHFYLLGEAIAIIPIIQDAAVLFTDTEVAVRSLIPLPSLGLGLAF